MFTSIHVVAFCVASVLATLAAGRLLAYVKSRRSGKSPAEQPVTAVEVAVPAPVPAPVVAAKAEPVVPRRKFFLSWAAVDRALKTGAVEEAELSQCLFCTSVAEMNLAEEADSKRFEYLYPFFAQANKDGRLISYKQVEYYNRTTFVELNELLERNGVAPLSCYPSGTLEDIPMFSAVPSVSDASMEVLWAAQPLRGDWKRCWGRTLEQIETEFANAEDEPELPRANWMQEMNAPIIEELRRKYEKPAPQSQDEFPGEEGDDDDHADDWKKGIQND